MKRVRPMLAGAGLAALLGGCIPQRIVWSPDGRQAAVLGGEDDNGYDLYFADAEGRLGPKQAANVCRVAWFPDSRRVVLARLEKVDSWPRLAELLSREEQEFLDQTARHMESAIKASAYREGRPSFDQDWERVVSRYLAEQRVTDAQVDAIKLYLARDERPAADPRAARRWGVLSPVTVCSLQLAAIEGDGLELGPIIHAALWPVWDIRVSPSGTAVAFTAGDPLSNHKRPIDLMLHTIGGTQPGLTVARQVAAYPDWSADGRALVYIEAVAGQPRPDSDDLRLAAVTRQEIFDETGALVLAEKREEQLAGTLMSDLARVRCLKDGRIIFSGAEVCLPATPQDMPEAVQLFVLDPRQAATVGRLIPRQEQRTVGNGDFLWLFEVSPDERWIAFPGPGRQVVLLSLTMGGVFTVDRPDAGDGDAPRTVPAWRAPDDLCYARSVDPEGAKGPAEIVLRPHPPAEEPRPISASWPREVAAGFLD